MKFTFKNGIHPHDNKEIAQDIPLREFPTPPKVYISLSQHIGAPAEAVVAVGDKVKAGTLIGKAREKALSCNVYSSVSGTVTGIALQPTATGGKSMHVEIENDGLYEEELLPPLENPDGAAIVQRIRQAGIVGMGGATFPTAVKLTPSKPVDTLIVNGAECEPYITCDYRIMLERTEEFFRGVGYVMKALGVTEAYIGVEKNKPQAIEKLRAFETEHVHVCGLETKYPQGAEKQLIYALLRRKVPCGALPMEVGVVGLNFQTVLAVYEAVELNKPSYRRALTVSGRGIDKPANLWVRTGVSYQDLYDYCTEEGSQPYYQKIISGGPMMGFAQPNLNAKVAKGTSAVLFLTEEEINTKPISTCINCSRCRKVCPMNLMPMMFERSVESGDLTTAEKYGIMNCMECGSCTFVCPAGRHIIQSIRLGKKLLREQKK